MNKPDAEIALLTGSAISHNDEGNAASFDLAIDERIGELWSEVLNVETVETGDNFFDLGGDSVQVMQVISRVHRELKVNIPLKTLFDYPTVREFAREVIKARMA